MFAPRDFSLTILFMVTRGNFLKIKKKHHKYRCMYIHILFHHSNCKTRIIRLLSHPRNSHLSSNRALFCFFNQIKIPNSLFRERRTEVARKQQASSKKTKRCLRSFFSVVFSRFPLNYYLSLCARFPLLFPFFCVLYDDKLLV